MHGFNNSDYSGDRATRWSITGFIVYVLRVVISWMLKVQRSVTLSSTEAKYVALSETSVEIIFLKQVLEFLGFEVKYPIVVHVDNRAAIYFANNETTSAPTNHLEVYYHFVREFIEDGVMKIIYVKTNENSADMFTKNLRYKQLYYHASKYVRNVPGPVKTSKIKQEVVAVIIERKGVESHVMTNESDAITTSDERHSVMSTGGW